MPDNKVCYVGKGQGNRLNQCLRRARRPETKGDQKRLCRKLREVMASGKDVVPRIVYKTDDEIDALHAEAEQIRHYGFENLFNVASHAFLGRTLKPEVRQDIAEASRRMWRNQAYRTHQLAIRRGRKFPNRKRPSRFKFPKNHFDAKYRGVTRWTCAGKSSRWMARITVNKKTKNLGYFNTLTEALRAYDNEAEKMHGIRPNKT